MNSSIAQTLAQNLLNPAKLEMLKLIACVDTINVRHGYADGTWVLNYANGQVVAGGYAAEAYSNGDCAFGETVTLALDELSLRDICSLADAAANLLAETQVSSYANENVTTLGMTFHLTNALMSSGIRTLAQLATQSRESLMQLPGIGIKSVYLIKELLAEKGLTSMVS